VRPGIKLWTAEEDDVLRQQASAGTSIAEIAAKIGRTKSALRARAYVLRLSLRSTGASRSSFGLQVEGE
jgi:hypothetical protein